VKLLLGKDEYVSKWIAQRIPHIAEIGLPPSVTFGVIDDAETRMLGAVAFHDHREHVRSIEWSAAAATPNWLNRGIINAIMAYPFGQLGCVRITAIIPKRNRRSRDFQERFGFKNEGLVRRGFGGDDACIYGLLNSEWKRSPFNMNRQEPAELRVA